MGAIAAHMAEGLDVRQDVWISPNGGARQEADGRWTLAGGGKERYDALVIAHNGKCAERLTARQPSRQVHALLRARFGDRLPAQPRPGGGHMTLNSVYSLLFELPTGILPDAFDVELGPEARRALVRDLCGGATHVDSLCVRLHVGRASCAC